VVVAKPAVPIANPKTMGPIADTSWRPRPERRRSARRSWSTWRAARQRRR
jgi:hypothetical protein